MKTLVIGLCALAFVLGSLEFARSVVSSVDAAHLANAKRAIRGE